MNTNETPTSRDCSSGTDHITTWTIEPHGNGYALYSGRGPMQHGMNLVYMSDPDRNWEATKRLIEQAPKLLTSCQEMINAMIDYGCNVDDPPTQKHREIMLRAMNAVKNASCISQANSTQK